MFFVYPNYGLSGAGALIWLRWFRYNQKSTGKKPLPIIFSPGMVNDHKRAQLSSKQKKKKKFNLFQPLEKDSAIDFMYCSKMALALTSFWPLFLSRQRFAKVRLQNLSFTKLFGWTVPNGGSLLVFMKYWPGLRTSCGWEVELEDPKTPDVFERE